MLYIPSLSCVGSVSFVKRLTAADAEKIKTLDAKLAMTINRTNLLQSNRLMQTTS